MKPLLACLVFFMLTPPLLAQTLVVRSGEHDDFTRLVIDLPDEREWSLVQEGTAAQLMVSGSDTRFDFSAVFSRIPRTRLASIDQAAPGDPLQLDLACDCPLKSFQEAGGFIVIDIGDPPPRTDPAPTTSRTRPVPRPRAINVLPLGGLPQDRSDPPRIAPPAVPEPGAAIYGLMAGLAIGEARISRPVIPAFVGQAEQRLQSQIARAASQGLIQMVETEPQAPDRGDDRDISVDPGSAPINLRAMTSVDRDSQSGNSTPGIVAGAVRCIGSDRLDIAAWGDGRPFGQQIGAFRSRLVGEFDDISQAELTGLAKTYLFFGFGAEARLLLAETAGSAGGDRILRSLATLLETGDLKHPHVFTGQSHCETPAALWSVYASPIGPDDAVNEEAVLRAFVALPAHIRAQIGPALARRFSRAGRDDAADRLLRNINRSDPPGSPVLQLVEADLARLGGNDAEADNLIEQVALDGNEKSVEALVALVDRHFQKREPLPMDTVTLLDSYRFETRHAAIGPDVLRSLAVAHALAGDFHAAAEIAADLRGSVADSASEQILSLLTERADPVTFLEMAFAEVRDRHRNLPESLVFDLARRFGELGFPEAAAQLARHRTSGRMAEEFALVRAESALALGFPRRALLELVRNESPSADRLRAEALQRIGSHLQAAEMFSATNAAEDAARSRWLAGAPPDAEGAAPQTDYDTRLAIQQRLTDARSPDSELTLASARDLLAEAEEVRRDIESLKR